MPLYLTESDVSSLLEPSDAVEAIEECLRRIARGAVENAPRRRLRLEDGSLADMAASDRGARSRRRKAVHGVACRCELRRLPLRCREVRARGRDRSRPARSAAHGSGERGRGSTSRTGGRPVARRPRMRQSGGDAGGMHPRRAAGDRAGRRLLPNARAARRRSATWSAPSRARATETRPRRTSSSR